MILGTEVSEDVRAREELRQAKEEADKANQTKSTFLANISHEIRTPLSAILGFTDLLRDEYEPSSDAAYFVDRISKNARQLGHLINELLDLSKIEANRLEIEMVPVQVERVIEDVASSLNLQAKEKSLRIDVKKCGEIPAKIISDPARLKQILVNLVGNSIKFTETGHIEIEYSISSKDGHNKLEVRVTDSGIGMTAEQARRLFQPFTQADSSITRKFGGTGLGLVLSQQLARLLGGDLTLEKSALGHGSTFLLQAEVELEGQTQNLKNETKTKSAVGIQNLHGRKILIVDDVPDNQALVRLYLNRLEAEHESAVDGEEAIEKALNGNFDAVLMDLQMPKVDGLTATKELRKKGYDKPIIAFTAHALRGEREKCLAGGFNEYITKPIDKNQMMKTLVDFLK
jgi:CheY-like chemotaxis protein